MDRYCYYWLEYAYYERSYSRVCNSMRTVIRVVYDL